MAFRTPRDLELTALLISPNRELADAFLATVPVVRGFQILADLRTYPHLQTLEIRLRQLRPEVAFVDLTSNLEQAGEIIRYLSSLKPPVFAIGLHSHNDSEAILHSVRQGASEFLYAPFDVEVQQEALARLRRLRQPEAGEEEQQGRILAFSSSKPGSGASTLATQMAFALRRTTGKRVLLVDLDPTGGAIGFYLKLTHQPSVLDLLQASQFGNVNWADYTVSCGGVDVLPGPDAPRLEPFDPVRYQEFFHQARMFYDWVVADLPSVFHRISLLAFAETERSYLVSTTELPSLHLTKKALGFLSQLGFGKDRIHLVLNRVNPKDGIAGQDLSKLFDCTVQASFPNDYFSLHRVITLGRPLSSDCELGRSIEVLAAKIAGSEAGEKKRAGHVLHAKATLAET
ncbi:MAG: AAA family ATPase [Bryobacteraceae bacterium]|nr:AAA family ATPase [Bryobacteraceae bacterium]MDW8378557.1 AAA family ATPase [Bryobacterales bacterium]